MLVINEQVQYFSCLADIFQLLLPILKHRFLRIILCLLFGLSDMMHKAIGNTFQRLLPSRLKIAQ